jgi:hypothetical protein
MSTTYIQTGELKTVIALTNVDAHLGHGSWKDYPVACVPKAADYTQIFRGENEGSSTICTDGYVVYAAADGTKFNLTWNCTMSGKNEISFSMDPLSGPWAHGDVYATGRFNSSYYWEIIQKTNTFVDAPVFAEDIVKAEKCSLTSQEDVEKYIDGRKCVYLKDCFADKHMRPYEKIWCAINPLFLTPISKSVLLRELTESVVNETGSSAFGDLADKLLNYNLGMSDGRYSLSEASQLRAGLQKILEEENDLNIHTLMGVAGSLLTKDLDRGWREGVHAYLSTQDKKELIRRQDRVIALVEEHL